MKNTKISPQEFITLLQKLLNEKIPANHLIALGSAIATLKFDDWKSVGGNIFIKDLRPIYHASKAKVISFKELKKNIKEDGPKSFFKNIAKNSKDVFKTSLHSAKVNIPDAKDRLAIFTKKIARDYSQLKTNEDRGTYILKLSLYGGIFALAFQKGAKQKMLSRSTLPLITLGVTLLFVNRILEQAEEKLEDQGAIGLSKDLRSLLRTLNNGFTSGMTFNIMVDGLVDQKIQINDLNGKTIGSLMPRSIVDNMIYTTLMGLFSTEKF
jgi:hypothetical protein